MASVDAMRERIVAKGDWTIVWQTGEELVVKGIALDREANEQGGLWGLTDGSAGLRGQIIRSSSVAEIGLACHNSTVRGGLQFARTAVDPV